MRREFHVRFCEGGGVRVPSATRLAILVGSLRRFDWLLTAVNRRLREELGKLQVEVNEEKSRTVDLAQGESFGYLGFDFRRVRSLSGKWRAQRVPKAKKRTELLGRLREIFKRYRSQPVTLVLERINPILRGWVNYFAYGNSTRCFGYVREWVEKAVRRHLMRNSKRRGFGWKRRSTRWLHTNLGLFDGYRVTYSRPSQKVLPV